MTLVNTKVEELGEEKDIKLNIDFNNPEALIPLFDSLTDQYGDPVNDLTREVVSNAIDATTRISKKDRKPIEITSPTVDNPYFIVQDFGTGMTKDLIENNYTAFLGSTKIFDPTQIGSHGQGAKAPLTYTSEYTVETTCDGTTIEFFVSRTERGYKYGFIDIDENSNKKNGTKVIIPAEPADNNRFAAALDSYKKFAFDTPLVIDGVLYEVNDNYVHLSDIVLDIEEGRTGRVFILKNSLATLLNDYVQSNYKAYNENISYSLGGWIYNNPNSNYSYNGAANPAIIVELIPNVLDFTKSRSEITNNKRSKEMHERILGFLKEKDTKEKFIKVYKTFDNARALDFALNLVVDKKGFEKRELSLGHTDYSFDNFTTLSGFNPYDLLYTEYMADSYGVISYSSGRTTTVSMLNKRSPFFANIHKKYGMDIFVEFFPGLYENARISQISTAVKENFEKGFSSSSSGAAFAALAAERKQQKGKIAIINDLDKKSLATILSSSKAISVLGYELVVLAQDVDSVKKNVEKFGEFLNISTVKAIDLATELKEYKKANSNVKGKKEILEQSFEFANYGDFDKLVEGFSADNSYFRDKNNKPTTVELTLSEAMERNVNLLICDSHGQFETLIKGMANSDEVISGDVYMFYNPSSLYSHHFSELLNYDKVFINSAYRIKRAKSAEKLKEKREFYGKFFDTTANGLSVPDMISAYVYPHDNKIRSFLKEIALFIFENNYSGNEELFNISFSLMTAMDVAPSMDALQIVDYTFFKTNVENYYLFDALKNVIDEIRVNSNSYYNYSGNNSVDMEATMINLLLNNANRQNTNKIIEEELYKGFVDRFVKTVEKQKVKM